MCFNSLLNATTKIGKNSNNNAVFQNSTVNGPIIVSSSTEDLISISQNLFFVKSFFKKLI